MDENLSREDLDDIKNLKKIAIESIIEAHNYIRKINMNRNELEHLKLKEEINI